MQPDTGQASAEGTVRLGGDQTPASAAGRELPPRRLGEFVLLREIGRGGMGLVYEAVQERLQRRVALKVLPATGQTPDEDIQRFRREAESIASLAHENIVDVYTYGEQDQYYYFAMPLVEGSSLDQVLAGRRLALEEVLDIALQVARALEKAHGQGVIHRDIKPGNILVDRSGKVRVADFGLAKWAHRRMVTIIGTVLGTPEYMSPEQAEGRDLGPATDIYSMGVLLFQMLCGRVPFSAPNPLTVLLKHLREAPPHPCDLNPEVPLELGEIVVRCLAKSEAERYQTAGELRRALERCQSELAEVATFLARDGMDTRRLVLATLGPVPAPPAAARTSPYKRGLARVEATALAARLADPDLLAPDQPPQEVTRRLEELYARLRGVVESAGGTVVRVFRGRLLAGFGTPIPLDDHARAAREAARALVEAARPHALAVGLASGPLVAGYVHDGRRRAYDLLGAPVDGALELAGRAGPGEVLVGPGLPV